MALRTCTVPVTISRNDTSVTASNVSASGHLVGVSVTAGAMEDSSTYTIAIKDRYGMTVYSKSSLLPSNTTTNWADLYGGSTAVHPLDIPMVGPVSVTITASTTQGHMSVAYTAYLYYDN